MIRILKSYKKINNPRFYYRLSRYEIEQNLSDKFDKWFENLDVENI